MKEEKKRIPCPKKGCNGQFHAISTHLQDRARVTGQYVYFPGDYSRVRKKKCNKCGYELRTVEIGLNQYVKDLTLIRKLKVALREYIGD